MKHAIKVSPFSCGTGCFHRTDDITNANSYVGYSLILVQSYTEKGRGVKTIFVYSFDAGGEQVTVHSVLSNTLRDAQNLC